MDKRCPRGLVRHPKRPCPEGKKAIDALRNNEQGGCEWYINDAGSHFCFFKYMHENNLPIDTSKIASLLMIDDNEVKKIVQAFRRKAQQNPDLSL